MDTSAWLTEIVRRGHPYGREDSVKWRRATVLEERTLIGVDACHLPVDEVLTMARAQGMPAAHDDTLRHFHPLANKVFFGVEIDGARCVMKVYLELWDHLREQVRTTGATAPALLNVGIKWDRHSGAHGRADYICHPMLSPAGVIGRIGQVCRQMALPHAGEIHARLMRQAMQAAPQSSFLYVEVQEAGSPRHSFDVNLYKAGLKVSDAAQVVHDLGRHFMIADTRTHALLARMGPHPLGHVSGGCDRHGDEFATLYFEIAPQPHRAG